MKSLIFGAVAAHAQRFLATESLSSSIPGCVKQGTGTMSDSCELCEAGLYLYRMQDGDDKSIFKNICVFDCRATDVNTAPDASRRQCVYLGPACREFGMITPTNSDDVQVKPLSCISSPLTEQGYVISTRNNIQLFLNNTEDLGLSEIVPTFELRKQQSYLYTEPIKMITGSTPVNSNSARSIAKCFGKKCKSCSSTALNQCDPCSTKFYDAAVDSTKGYCKESNFCAVNNDAAGCCTPESGQTFDQGCLSADASCSWCDVCKPQYGRNGLLDSCVSCTSGSDNENCEDCTSTGNTVNCKLCQIGYGLNKDSDCVECSMANVRNCKFDDEGTELPDFCQEPYTVSQDKKKCVLACAADEFQSLTFNTDISAVTSFFCEKCDDSCASCSGSAETDCLTCKEGKYLNSANACTEKAGALKGTVEAPEAVKLLVLNAGNKDQAATIDESTEKTVVHTDLLSAIFQAFKLSTPHLKASVEILMQKGTHYILPSHTEQFRIDRMENKLVDFKNSKLDLLIKPVSCSALSIPDVTYAGLSSTCANDNEKTAVVIRNKAKAEFELFVPSKLRVQALLFEAIDSVDAELNDAEGIDFEWKTGSDYPEPTGSRQRGSFDLYPVCKYRSYASLFQFIMPLRDISSVDDAPALEIVDCTFQNFFYELGSIVRLPERTVSSVPWKVTITGSTFDKMSFCGSIVADDFPRFTSSTDSDQTLVFKSSLEHVISSRFIYEGTSSLDCAAVNCQQLTFSSNTVKELFKFKSLENKPYTNDRVHPAMARFGLIVHLQDSPTTVTISGNTVQSVGMKFSEVCSLEGSGEYFTFSPVVNSDNEPWYERWSKDTLVSRETRVVPQDIATATLQSHHLFLVRSKSNKPVTFTSNSISNVVLSNSLVHISQEGFSDDTDPAAFAFSENSFTSVASYLGTSVLAFTRQDSASEISKQNPKCLASTQILQNTFNKVATSCLADTGLLRIQCNNTKLAAQDQTIFDQIRSIAFLPEFTLEEATITTLSDTTKTPSPPTLRIESNTVTNSASAQQQKDEFGAFIFVSGGFKLQALTNTITNQFPSNHRANFLSHSPFATYLGWSIAGGSTSISQASSGPAWSILYPCFVNFETIKLLSSNIAGSSSTQGSFIQLKASFKEVSVTGMQATTVAGVGSPLFQIEGLAAQPSFEATLSFTNTIISSITLTNDPTSLTLSDLKSYQQVPLFLKADSSTLNLALVAVATLSASTIGIQGHSLTSSSSDFLSKHSSHSKVGSLLSSVSKVSTLSGLTVSNADFVSNFGEVAFSALSAPSSAAGARVITFTDDSLTTAKVLDFAFKADHFIKTKVVSTEGSQNVKLLDSTFENVYFGSIFSIGSLPEEAAQLEALVLSLAANQALYGVETQGVTEALVLLETITMTNVFDIQLRTLPSKDVSSFQVAKPSLVAIEDNEEASSSTLTLKGFTINNHLGTLQKGLQTGNSAILPFSFELVSSHSRFARISFDAVNFLAAQDALDFSTRWVSLLTFECSSSKPNFSFKDSTFKSSNTDTLVLDSFTANELTLRERLKLETTNVKRYKSLFSFQDCATSQSTDLPAVVFQNTDLINLKLDSSDSATSTYLEVGSLLNLVNTEISITEMEATNVVSEASGAVFSISDSSSSSFDQIQIASSAFSQVSSYRNGSVITYSSTQKALPDGFVKVSISDSSFLNNQANYSAGIAYESTNTQLVMTKLTVQENTVLQSGSFAVLQGWFDISKKPSSGFEVKFNEQNSAIILSGSTFEKNTAKNGPATFIVIDQSISFDETSFSDCSATKVTNGILLSRSDSSIETQGMHVVDCKFTFTEVTPVQDGIMGGFIHASNYMLVTNLPSTTDSSDYSIKQYTKLKLNVIILESSFISGTAQRGGAIYTSSERSYNVKGTILMTIYTDLEFYVFSSKFDKNTASERGGAIYLHELDGHSAVIGGQSTSKSSFTNNKADQVGDAVYAVQTKRTVVEIKNADNRRRLATTDASSVFKIEYATFENPGGTGQVYLSTLEIVEILALEFMGNTNAQALEGGSIHMVDCVRISVKSSTFTDQSSIIKGGALFIRQKSDLFFGEDLFGEGDNKLILEDNTFKGCTSQQGSALFVSKMEKIELVETNTFQNQVALFYNQVPPYLGSYSSLSSISSDLELELMDMPLNFYKGRGPAIYFLFTADQLGKLTVILPEGTKLTNNRIKKIEEGVETLIDTNDKSHHQIFFQGLFPTDDIHSSLMEHCLKLNSMDTEGSDVAVLSSLVEFNQFNAALEAELETVGQSVVDLDFIFTNTISVDPDVTDFANLFSINAFDHSNKYLFGSEYPLGILDSNRKIQIHDHTSTFKIEVISDAQRRRLASTIEHMMYFDTDSLKKYTTYTWTAKYGQFDVPKVKFFAQAGSTIQLRFTFSLVQTGKDPTTITRLIDITTTGCGKGDIVSDEGFCEPCQGPDFYLTRFDDAEILKVYENKNECHDCVKTVFECKGGQEIAALENFQLVLKDSDVFVECPTFLGEKAPLCTGDNTCKDGYQGLLCSQCARGYFREVDGTCSSCLGPVWLRVFWFLLSFAYHGLAVAAIYYTSKGFLMTQKGESQPITTWIFLFKNFTNFILYTTLISEIAISVWQPLDDAKFFRFIFLLPLTIIKWIYKMPIAGSQHWQCLHADSDASTAYSPVSYSSLGEEDEVLQGADGYSPQTVLRIYTLLMNLLLLGLFLAVYKHKEIEARLPPYLKEKFPLKLPQAFEGDAQPKEEEEDVEQEAQKSHSEDVVPHEKGSVSTPESSNSSGCSKKSGDELDPSKTGSAVTMKKVGEKENSISRGNDSYLQPARMDSSDTQLNKVQHNPSETLRIKAADHKDEQESHREQPKAFIPKKSAFGTSDAANDIQMEGGDDSPDFAKEKNKQNKSEQVKKSASRRPSIMAASTPRSSELAVSRSSAMGASSTNPVRQKMLDFSAQPEVQTILNRDPTLRLQRQQSSALGQSVRHQHTQHYKQVGAFYEQEADSPRMSAEKALKQMLTKKFSKLSHTNSVLASFPDGASEISQKENVDENHLTLPKQEADTSGGRHNTPNVYQQHSKSFFGKNSSSHDLSIKNQGTVKAKYEDYFLEEELKSDDQSMGGNSPLPYFNSRHDLQEKPPLTKIPSAIYQRTLNMPSFEEAVGNPTSRSRLARSFAKKRSSPMRSPNPFSQGTIQIQDQLHTNLPVIDDLVGLGEERKEEESDEDDYFALKAERVRNNETEEPKPEAQTSLHGLFPIKERPDSVLVVPKGSTSLLKRPPAEEEEETLKTSSKCHPPRKEIGTSSKASNSVNYQNFVDSFSGLSKAPSKFSKRSSIRKGKGSTISSSNSLKKKLKSSSDGSKEKGTYSIPSISDLTPNREILHEYTVLLMMTGFVLNTQLADLILGQYAARKYRYSGYFDSELFALVDDKLPCFRNYLDSSIGWFPFDLYLLPNLGFLGVWLGFGLWYIVQKRKNDFQIEVSGQLVRVGLLLISKGHISSNPSASLALACFLMVGQFLVYWIYKDAQAITQNEAYKLKSFIHPVDNCMYGVVLIMSFLALMQSLTTNSFIQGFVFIILTIVLGGYFYMFLNQVYRLYRKHLVQHPKLLKAVLWLTCRMNQEEEILNREKIAQRVEEEHRQMMKGEMQKFQAVEHHLKDIQEKIISLDYLADDGTGSVQEYETKLKEKQRLRAEEIKKLEGNFGHIIMKNFSISLSNIHEGSIEQESSPIKIRNSLAERDSIEDAPNNVSIQAIPKKNESEILSIQPTRKLIHVIEDPQEESKKDVPSQRSEIANISLTSFRTEEQKEDPFTDELIVQEEENIVEPSSIDQEAGVLTEMAHNSPVWNPFKPTPVDCPSIQSSSVAPTEEGIRRPKVSAVGLKRKIMRVRSNLPERAKSMAAAQSRNQFRQNQVLLEHSSGIDQTKIYEGDKNSSCKSEMRTLSQIKKRSATIREKQQRPQGQTIDTLTGPSNRKAFIEVEENWSQYKEVNQSIHLEEACQAIINNLDELNNNSLFKEADLLNFGDTSAIGLNGEKDKSMHDIEKDLLLFGSKSNLQEESSLTNVDVQESYEQRINHEEYRTRNILEERLAAMMAQQQRQMEKLRKKSPRKKDIPVISDKKTLLEKLSQRSNEKAKAVHPLGEVHPLNLKYGDSIRKIHNDELIEAQAFEQLNRLTARASHRDHLPEEEVGMHLQTMQQPAISKRKVQRIKSAAKYNAYVQPYFQQKISDVQSSKQSTSLRRKLSQAPTISQVGSELRGFGQVPSARIQESLMFHPNPSFLTRRSREDSLESGRIITERKETEDSLIAGNNQHDLNKYVRDPPPALQLIQRIKKRVQSSIPSQRIPQQPLSWMSSADPFSHSRPPLPEQHQQFQSHTQQPASQQQMYQPHLSPKLQIPTFMPFNQHSQAQPSQMEPQNPMMQPSRMLSPQSQQPLAQIEESGRPPRMPKQKSVPNLRSSFSQVSLPQGIASNLIRDPQQQKQEGGPVFIQGSQVNIIINQNSSRDGEQPQSSQLTSPRGPPKTRPKTSKVGGTKKKALQGAGAGTTDQRMQGSKSSAFLRPNSPPDQGPQKQFSKPNLLALPSDISELEPEKTSLALSKKSNIDKEQVRIFQKKLQEIKSLQQTKKKRKQEMKMAYIGLKN